MDLSLKVLVSPGKAIAWTTAAAAIAVICLVSNFTITGAQQQPLQTGQQSSMPQSPTLLNSKDSFRLKLPAGWVIQDINNTGFTLAAEVLQGYGLLAQVCPQQEGEQSISSNYNSSMSNRYVGSCQHAGEEVIHIIRYPNLGARLGIASGDDVFTIIENWGTVPNAILSYHLQKLQEAGYRDFKIVRSMDTTINVDNSTDISNRRMATTTTIPAKLVEMTYSTSLATDEIRRGYFMLTATVSTPRNLGVMTGYSVFYEGTSTATTLAGNTTTTISPDSILASPTSIPASLPPPVIQIFDSFELVAASPTEPLTVEITSEETEGIAPATFEFEAEVSGGLEPYIIRWDFGEGGIISSEEEQEENNDDEEVEHTFEIDSMYNVRVLVTDSTGRTASDSILVTVDEPPPLTSVEITSNNTTGDAPATFEFEDEVIGGIEPFSYRWNFGDGSTATDDDEDIVHTFDAAGTYNVSLVVIDSTGRTATDSMVITVQVPLLPPSPPPLTAASIISNGTEGIAPATFEFEAEVSGGLEPYIIRWDFGDGSSDDESNIQTVLHTFDQSGRYDVDVIVIDSRNQIAFDSIAITVEEEEQEPPATEEGPNLDDLDNNSGSDDLFDLDDLLNSLELPNNVVNIGGTSSADDYDATADD